MHACLDVWDVRVCVYAYVCVCMDVCLYVCMDGWADGQRDDWMDGPEGWMAGWWSDALCMHGGKHIITTCVHIQSYLHYTFVHVFG